ncbi:MAG: hypothetical protein IJB75_06480 [Oscillospiraceae bacterium]|nr:hypothetical protein [Oscillospiraceae bacterium]
MDIIERYVAQFNATDNERYINHIDNAHAAAWMREEIPVLECPDKDIERTYYFRWWTFRKHIRNTADGFMISEFLPQVHWSARHNIINASTGHHIAEGRWLRTSHQYLDSYIDLLLSGQEDVKAHQYSSWLISALLDFYRTAGFGPDPKRILTLACRYHEVWEQKHLLPNGMFWSKDLPDGMEYSISGRDGLIETKGIRPTLNSYMYADRAAIAQLAERLGEEEIARTYRQKAADLRRLINENLYADGFYRAFHSTRDDLTDVFDQGGSAIVRELLGYIPWAFCIPERKDDAAFDLLTDPAVFHAPFGLTTADRSHPRFLYEADHMCLWNGYVWPFATAQALTALRNYVWHYNDSQTYKDMFLSLLRQYAQSHVMPSANGTFIPWVDEMQHPFTGEWPSRTWLESRQKPPAERGRYYNHSTFCDLVITGLAGVRTDKEALYLTPNIPADWDYFRLSNLWLRGERYTVEYQKGRPISLRKA